MPATFRASPSAPRLAVLDLGSDAPAGYWAGFWSRGGELEGSLSLAQTWERDGVYVFADSEPTNLAAFASSVAALIDQSGPLADLRMLWIRNAAAPTLAMLGSLRAAGPVLTAPCQLRFRGYEVLVGATTKLAVDSTGDAFILTPPDPSALVLITRAGIGRLPADSGAIATIPMIGRAAGTIRFPLTLQDLDLLDTGLRYFIGAAQDPAVEQPLGYGLSSLSYPVFDPEGGPLRLHLQFDPVRPLDRDRSHLAFLAPGEQSGAALSSHFVGRLGEPVRLRPVLAAGHPPPRLVFTESPELGPGVEQAILPAGGEASAYLSPQGVFELLSASGFAGPRRLLAGLSGSEYLGFEADSGNRLIFVADQPAYADGFRFAAPDSGSEPDGAAKLGAHATTSYVYVEGAAGKRSIYYAQPDESLLWKTGRPDLFLEFMELDAGRLPPPLADDGARRGFPLTPYRGVAADRAELARSFELRVLGSSRRATVLQYTQEQYAEPSKAGRPLATPDATAVTSLGLLASFEATTNVWSRLFLAMPKDRQNPLMLAGPAQGQDPDGIKGPLRAALQTNQLFMVVTNEAAFEQYGSLLNSIVGIEGWSFNLGPAVWRQHGTILIFKFNLEPLVELLADIRDWAHAELFNVDPKATRQRLLDIVATARAARDGADEAGADAFAEFNRLIDTPQWQGVLALQVDLPLSGLPDEIAALAAGIDDQKFMAHHLGVTLSPTTYDGSAHLEMDPSAYFGLIYYKDPPLDPVELPVTPPTYDFRVESLIVRFYNSIVVDFSSTVKLRVGALFEESVDLGGAFDPTLRLEGVLERHDGVASYGFATLEPTLMTLDSKVLRDVDLRHTQMKTIAAPGVGGGLLTAWFQFGGAIRFVVQDGLDAFGFGTEPDDAQASGGLEYTRMLLHMSVILPGPEQSVGRLVPNWRFDVTELVPNVPASVLRSRSLFGRFPLTLSAVVQGEAGSTPSSKGFLPVNSPMDQSTLGDPWFALQFALNLGSVGGLVGNKGLLADLLIAWSPTARGTSTFMGLRLPAPFGGAKGFNLQGLFKVGLSDIDLFVSEPDDPAYTMVLRDIGFELLSLKFPPVGGVNFVLFGDPSAKSKPASLGWYLAYTKAG
jgi:hypothetical protein